MKKRHPAILIAGAPARYPDLRYATGFFSFDPVIFLIAKNQRHLAVSPLDFAHVKRTVRNTRVVSLADLPVQKNSKTPAADRTAALLKKAGIKAVTIPPYFPVGLANRLSNRGIITTVAEDGVLPEREIKTTREIGDISIAQQAAIKAMDQAVGLIAGAKIGRNGILKTGGRPLTSEAVRNAINACARDRNCICYGTIVACGAQAANPHETGFGPLKAGQTIVIDIFPQHIESGYWGDITRTVCRGTPPANIQKMYEAVCDAQRTAVAKIKAGVIAETVHNAVVELFKQRGFVTGKKHGRPSGFIHSTGHGIGLEIHEQPSVGPNKTRLEAGNVVTVEPGLYYPGQAGIRTEDIVLVTKTGCRKIGNAKYPFVL